MKTGSRAIVGVATLPALALLLCACTPYPLGEVGQVIAQEHAPAAGRFVIALVDDKKDFPGDFFALIHARYSRGPERHDCIEIGSTGGSRGVVLRDRFDVEYHYAPNGLYVGVPGTGAQLLCLHATPADAVRITVYFDHEDFDAMDDLQALNLQIPAPDAQAAGP
jgi:hypothetical protein